MLRTLLCRYLKDMLKDNTCINITSSLIFTLNDLYACLVASTTTWTSLSVAGDAATAAGSAVARGLDAAGCCKNLPLPGGGGVYT